MCFRDFTIIGDFQDAIIISGILPISSNVWKLCIQEALDLLQDLLSEINYVLTDGFSDEVPTNHLQEFSLDSKDNDQETELNLQ
ncbi:hypothetical protein TNCV_3188141 [Trichonephila clavipes]|nr:hypothetical protein TNCV_3188141 [Trichonephila clavipes]